MCVLQFQETTFRDLEKKFFEEIKTSVQKIAEIQRFVDLVKQITQNALHNRKVNF